MRNQPGAATLVVVVLSTLLLLFLFQQIIWIVLPVLMATMLYYILRPFVDGLVVGGMQREVATKVVCGIQAVAAIAFLVLALLVVAKAGTWQSNFERYVTGGRTFLNKSTVSLENLIPALKTAKLSDEVNKNLNDFTDGFVNRNLVPITLDALKWLPSLLLVPYICYFMLNDSNKLKKYIIKSVPNAFFEKALLLFSHLDASLQSYFQGLMLLTVLDAVSLGVGLAILGISHAILLALAAAVLSWIPYLGSIVGCFVVVLFAATDYPDQTWKAYACLCLFLVVRLLDDFVFMPLTIGRKLNVHPLLSVLMLFLGATVAGATGLFLALPLFGVVSVTGETVAQIVADRGLRDRYQAARQRSSVLSQLEIEQ